MVQGIWRKEKKQQHTVMGQKTLYYRLKIVVQGQKTGCTTTGVRNYCQRPSGWPKSGIAWDSLRTRRFLKCPLSSWQLQIFEQ
ncbi:hypothetical protein TNCV_4484311 [Trichonephila clavipes]|nr:hypothetical protein TNCV_4484311 [Trichonephila clavipes]